MKHQKNFKVERPMIDNVCRMIYKANLCSLVWCWFSFVLSPDVTDLCRER